MDVYALSSWLEYGKAKKTVGVPRTGKVFHWIKFHLLCEVALSACLCLTLGYSYGYVPNPTHLLS